MNMAPTEILVCSTLHQAFHLSTKGLIPQFLMAEQKLKWIFAKTLCNKTKRTRISENWLQQVMRHDIMDTMSNKPATFTMKVKSFQRPKNEWQSRLIVKTMFTVLCITSLFQEMKWCIKNSNCPFCTIHEKWCTINDLTFGMTQPLSSSWQCSHAHGTLCPEVLRNTTSKMVSGLPYSLDLSLALFLLCPELKVGLKQSQFESAQEIQ